MTERAATLAETSLHVAKGVGKGNVFNYLKLAPHVLNILQQMGCIICFSLLLV